MDTSGSTSARLDGHILHSNLTKPSISPTSTLTHRTTSSSRIVVIKINCNLKVPFQKEIFLLTNFLFKKIVIRLCDFLEKSKLFLLHLWSLFIYFLAILWLSLKSCFFRCSTTILSFVFGTLKINAQAAQDLTDLKPSGYLSPSQVDN